MAASSLMLNLPGWKVAFFVITIAIMSAALSGLAVGLGALFPNFKEDNPSKIVSGFGGTLCLVISFMYISLTVALVAIPGLRAAKVASIQFPISDRAALTLAFALSLALLLVPMSMAYRQVKNLEI
jgi:ABC-2 type transport system permease protein